MCRCCCRRRSAPRWGFAASRPPASGDGRCRPADCRATARSGDRRHRRRTAPSTPGPRGHRAPALDAAAGPLDPAGPLVAHHHAGRSHAPSTTWRSEWQTPTAAIRTSTSPRRGGSSRSCSISRSRVGPRKTTARVKAGRVSSIHGCHPPYGARAGMSPALVAVNSRVLPHGRTWMLPPSIRTGALGVPSW